jgi:hypothetical protein
MYRLRDLKNGRYQIHVNNGPAYEGSLTSIVRECTRLGLKFDQVEVAVLELNRLDDDYAEFGVFGHFMYTVRDAKVA